MRWICESRKFSSNLRVFSHGENGENDRNAIDLGDSQPITCEVIACARKPYNNVRWVESLLSSPSLILIFRFVLHTFHSCFCQRRQPHTHKRLCAVSFSLSIVGIVGPNRTHFVAYRSSLIREFTSQPHVVWTVFVVSFHFLIRFHVVLLLPCVCVMMPLSIGNSFPDCIEMIQKPAHSRRPNERQLSIKINLICSNVEQSSFHRTNDIKLSRWLCQVTRRQAHNYW